LNHQRIDFTLMSMDELVNFAAKWHFMFGGQSNVPLVIRAVIGRGWGQGAQHSQNLHALFAHIPGLKVLMPATAEDAKGLLIAAIADPNPIIFIEHRWLHPITGYVPEAPIVTPIGKANILRAGRDVTIVAASYMVVEAIRAAEALEKIGIEAEVVDLRTIKPWDKELVLESVRRTQNLFVADTGWQSFGLASEIIAVVCEQAFTQLKTAPARLTLKDCSTPSGPGLTKDFYPTHKDMVKGVLKLLKLDPKACDASLKQNNLVGSILHDVPDKDFKGPF
jgi:pyruvate/2-oxoglutarate/acetoin dehydrogenase E1 component